MAGPCSDTFERLARQLGGKLSCRSGNAVVNLRAPWKLTNWTLPVVEALMVAGAIYALVHARHRWRSGDPTVASLTIAAMVFLLVIEPPVYFPQQIRLPGQSQIVFVHNAFTVQFLWDRLPLYIVALYLAVFTLCFEIVRGLGVFRRRGVFGGAVAVGCVTHCFYEVFDHLGPQLRWWAWNAQADASHPAVANVPMTSIVVFATVAPAALAGLVYWLVGRPVDRGERVAGSRLIGRSIVAGLLMLVATALGGLPWRIFNTANPNNPAQTTTMAAVVAVIVVAGAVLLVSCWRESRTDGTPVDDDVRRYVMFFGWIYLAVFAFLWLTALPDYLRVVGGITPSGTPIGSLPYAALCFLGAAASLLLVASQDSATSDDATRADELPVHH
jgi:hypothetical protein